MFCAYMSEGTARTPGCAAIGAAALHGAIIRRPERVRGIVAARARECLPDADKRRIEEEQRPADGGQCRRPTELLEGIRVERRLGAETPSSARTLAGGHAPGSRRDAMPAPPRPRRRAGLARSVNRGRRRRLKRWQRAH